MSLILHSALASVCLVCPPWSGLDDESVEQAARLLAQADTALEGGDLAAASGKATAAEQLVVKLPEQHPMRIEVEMAALVYRAAAKSINGDWAKPFTRPDELDSRRRRSDDPMTAANAAVAATARPDGPLDAEAVTRVRVRAARVLEAAADNAARLGPAANSILVGVWLNAAAIRMSCGADDLRAVSRAAAEASRRLRSDDPMEAAISLDVQRLVWGYWTRLRVLAESVRAAEGDQGVDAALERSLGAYRAAARSADLEANWLGWEELQRLILHRQTQRVDALLASLERLDACIAASGEHPPSLFLAYALATRGNLRIELSEYAGAADDLEQAVAMATREAFSPLERAYFLHQRGVLRLRLGDFRAAREDLTKAVEVYNNTPAAAGTSERALALSHLAKTYEWTNEPDLAKLLHEQAKAVSETADPFTRCLCGNNYAVQLYLSGDLDGAATEFAATRALAESALSASSHRLAELDVNRGWVALDRGDAAGAEQLFRSAAEVFERRAGGAAAERHAEVLGYLARVLVALNRTEEAREALTRAADLRTESLERVLSSAASEPDRLAYLQALRAHPEAKGWPGAFDSFLELGPSLGVPVDEQYARVLVWKGAAARHATPGRDQLEDDPNIGRLADERSSLMKQLRAESLAESRDEQEQSQRLAEIARRLASNESALRAASPRFARLTGAPAPDVARIAAAVPPGSALLDVVEVLTLAERRPGEPRAESRVYIGFLVKPNQPPIRIEFGHGVLLDRLANRFVIDLIEGGDFKASGAALAAVVRRPLDVHLEGVDRLILCGDGAFLGLPMAALPGPVAGRYWVEDLAFCSVPDAPAILKGTPLASETPATSLVVGGVEFGPLASTYPPLPGTLVEAEFVAKTFQRAFPSGRLNRLEGPQASEAAVRAALPTARFVHLATHGFFREDEEERGRFDVYGFRAGLDSGLILAPRTVTAGGPASPPQEVPNDAPNDDQRLTALELESLNLDGTRLVVLSGCSTGRGHAQAGQGLVGLLASLRGAGVETVVGSYWAVDDASSAALMMAFYRELWDRPGEVAPEQALRAAQLEMIRKGGTEAGERSLAHPKNWASFFVMGPPA